MSGKKYDIIKMGKVKRHLTLLNRLAGRGDVRLPRLSYAVKIGLKKADIDSESWNATKSFQDREIVRTAFLKLSLTGMRRRNGRFKDYAVQPPG